MKQRIKSPYRGLGAALAALALVLWFFASIHQVTLGQKAEGTRILERTIRRAAVTCYATEGIYPPSLDYLMEHYGVQFQEEQYEVFYDVFAENLMPEITVLEKKVP